MANGCVKTPAGTCGLVLDSSECGALSLPLEGRYYVSADNLDSSQEELGVATTDGFDQLIPVPFGLGNRLAER